jgi:hypothetical protein
MSLFSILGMLRDSFNEQEYALKKEEAHRARMAELETVIVPPFRTVEDVAKALSVTNTRARKILEEHTPRLKIIHQKGKKWKISEEEFQRIIALKNK